MLTIRSIFVNNRILNLYNMRICLNFHYRPVIVKMNRSCRNDPNRFCYICGEIILPKRRSNITKFVKKTYHAYFGVRLGDQDKPFAPHVCCKTCVESLRRWKNKETKSLQFGVPMIWREGKDHISDCYFCMINLKGT